MKPRFLVSYAGEVDYDVAGERYRVRYFGIPHIPWNTNVWQGQILPEIGTVRYDDSRKFHTFPPAAIVELFPGFVGARWNTDTWTLEYDGPAPTLIPHPKVSDYITFANPHDPDQQPTTETETA